MAVKTFTPKFRKGTGKYEEEKKGTKATGTEPATKKTKTDNKQ